MLLRFTHPESWQASTEQQWSGKCVLPLLGPPVLPPAAAFPPSLPWGSRWPTVGAAAPSQSGCTCHSRTWKGQQSSLMQPCPTERTGARPLGHLPSLRHTVLIITSASSGLRKSLNLIPCWYFPCGGSVNFSGQNKLWILYLWYWVRRPIIF